MRPSLHFILFYATLVIDAKPFGARPSNPLTKRASGVSWNAADANGQTFDFIIVGGGLTGLTTASRLAETGQSILVVEAGRDDRWNPIVQDVFKYGEFFGSDLNWQWPAEDGRTIPAGKTLGGSSSINGAAWTRGLDAQYDVLSELLEPSEASLQWNWENLFGYMKKAEGFSAPNDQQREKGADGINEYHGTDGPVQVTFSDSMYGGPQQKAFVSSITSLTGLTYSRDLNGGQPNCVAFTPNSINWHDQDHRSTAASSYLTPQEGSTPNWLTLVNHSVTKLVWGGKDANGNHVVDGIEFQQTDWHGQAYTAKARKEVILAAGAIATPALLQLSGVGDSAHLSSLGIETIIELKTVGKNLQEQAQNAFGANSNGFDWGGQGPSNVIAFPNLYQVFGKDQGKAVASQIKSSLKTWAQNQAGNALDAAALEAIYAIQTDLIVNKNAPVIEMFYDTGYPNAIGIDMWTLLPYSRGSVQIESADPFQKPHVQVNWFKVDMDLKIHVAGARLARQLFRTGEIGALSSGETQPGAAIPEEASQEDWESWVLNNYQAVAHPIGSCAMMRRSLGGVVDGRLRLYSAANLRIVDGSTLPLQISGHLSSTLYAFAEKAADIIKSGL